MHSTSAVIKTKQLNLIKKTMSSCKARTLHSKLSTNIARNKKYTRVFVQKTIVLVHVPKLHGVGLCQLLCVIVN